MLCMFLEGGAIHRDVIQVHDNKAVEEWLEDFIHNCLKCGRYIGEAKSHNKEFKKSVPYDASCLWFISFGN